MKFEPFTISIDTPAEAVVLIAKLEAPFSHKTAHGVPETIMEDFRDDLEEADVDLHGKVVNHIDLTAMSAISIDNYLNDTTEDDDDMVSVPRRLLDELMEYV